jgi:hypothetical protein
MTSNLSKVLTIFVAACAAEIVSSLFKWFFLHSGSLPRDYFAFSVSLAGIPIVLGFYLRRAGLPFVYVGPSAISLAITAFLATSAKFWLESAGASAYVGLARSIALVNVVPQILFAWVGAYLAQEVSREP